MRQADFLSRRFFLIFHHRCMFSQYERLVLCPCCCCLSADGFIFFGVYIYKCASQFYSTKSLNVIECRRGVSNSTLDLKIVNSIETIVVTRLTFCVCFSFFSFYMNASHDKCLAARHFTSVEYIYYSNMLLLLDPMKFIRFVPLCILA